MTLLTLIHPEVTVTVPIVQAVNKCTLLQRNPVLLSSPYRVQSFVPQSIFREFVTELEGNSVTITDTNFRGLQELCNELGFSDLAARLSAFDPSIGLEEAEARGQIPAQGEKAEQQDDALTVKLVLNGAVFEVPSLALRQVCTKFPTTPQYSVASKVSAKNFGEFLSALEGETIEVTKANLKELSALCDEFGFALKSPSYRLAEVEEKAENNGQRMAALEKKVEQQNGAIAILESELGRLADLGNDLVQKVTELIRKGNDLVEKETKLAQKGNDLVEKETELAQKENDLVWKETELAQKENDLVQKETERLRKGTDLVERETEFLRKGNHLVQKEAVLAQNEKDLDEKKADLVQKGKDLDAEKAHLAQRERDLDEKKADLVQKGKYLDAEKAYFARREMALVENDMEFIGKQNHHIEKETEFVKEVTEFAKKEAERHHKRAELRREQAKLESEQSQLNQKNLDIVGNETDLLKKETELALKETALVQRETDLLKKETNLAQRETDLSPKTTDLLEKAPTQSVTPPPVPNRPPRFPSLDSRIISDFPEIFAEFRRKHFELLWRGSRDGFSAKEFHGRCDGHANTLTVILDTKGNIFGGFTPVVWDSKSNWKADDSLRSFVFTLKNPYNVPARKFALKADMKTKAIGCSSKHGPCFGAGIDLAIQENCNTSTKSSTSLGNSYTNDTGRDGRIVFTGSKPFQVKEIEVFEITN